MKTCPVAVLKISSTCTLTLTQIQYLLYPNEEILGENNYLKPEVIANEVFYYRTYKKFLHQLHSSLTYSTSEWNRSLSFKEIFTKHCKSRCIPHTVKEYNRHFSGYFGIRHRLSVTNSHHSQGGGNDLHGS